MIDIHCHLNFHAFHKDYDELIHQAEKDGVPHIINVGTKLDSSEEAVAVAESYDDLYAIVGVHPHHADKLALNQEARSMNQGEIASSDFSAQDRSPAGWLIELERIAKSSKKVVGIGEIGLDYFRYQSNGIADPTLQKEIFEAQIELAHRLRLPLQIHGRHAGKDILEIL